MNHIRGGVNPARPGTALIHLAIAGMLLGAGCKRDAAPAAAEPTASESGNATPAASPQPAPPHVQAADPRQDDADSPKWLPRPDDIRGWVRVANTAVLDHNEWSGLADSGLQRVAQGFATTSITQTRFTSVAPNEAGTTVEVSIATTASNDDAFGFFKARFPTECDRAVGTLAASTLEEGRFRRGCWQGRCVFEAAITTPDSTLANSAIDKLLAGLVQPIPSMDQPAMLAQFPTRSRIDGHEWLARGRLDVLPVAVQRDALRGSAQPAAAALHLGPDTLMGVVAYDPGDGEKPNYVWMIRYPTDVAATEAYMSYKKLLTSIRPVADVMMELPRGRYLYGTWTREQESIPSMHILADITAAIPDP